MFIVALCFGARATRRMWPPVCPIPGILRKGALWRLFRLSMPGEVAEIRTTLRRSPISGRSLSRTEPTARQGKSIGVKRERYPFAGEVCCNFLTFVVLLRVDDRFSLHLAETAALSGGHRPFAGHPPDRAVDRELGVGHHSRQGSAAFQGDRLHCPSGWSSHRDVTRPHQARDYGGGQGHPGDGVGEPSRGERCQLARRLSRGTHENLP